MNITIKLMPIKIDANFGTLLFPVTFSAIRLFLLIIIIIEGD